MTLDVSTAFERVLSEGDEWMSWRALRLSGDDNGPVPNIPSQAEDGSFSGVDGRPSPGSTGLALCHLKMLGLADSDAASRAASWLEGARTPAQAWLDAPSSVPGPLDDSGGARVWATATAACALTAVGKDPGPRALELLRGEGASDGGITGGALPSIAAAGAFWLADGPKSEMAEWTLRWVREDVDEIAPEEALIAGIIWAAATIPGEHPSVEAVIDLIREEVGQAGFRDLDDTLTGLEVLAHFEGPGIISE